MRRHDVRRRASAIRSTLRSLTSMGASAGTCRDSCRAEPRDDSNVASGRRRRSLVRSTRWTRAIAVVWLLLACAGLARASEFADDLAARRARIMERLGPDTMLVLWSAPPQRY